MKMRFFFTIQHLIELGMLKHANNLLITYVIIRKFNMQQLTTTAQFTTTMHEELIFIQNYYVTSIDCIYLYSKIKYPDKNRREG